MREFALIEQYFSNAGYKRNDVSIAVGDDGAVMQVREGFDLVVTTDTMVQGVHFFPNVDPRALGHKLVTVNVSDLAAMGAEPCWLSLGLTLPDADEAWIKAFAEGLSETADYYNCQLIGGDTCKGPLTLTVCAKGIVPRGKALTRSGAKVGDYLYVTGTLGDAALGLLVEQGLVEISKKHRGPALQKFHYPTARVALGQALRAIASSCMDVSDGLCGDLPHILKRSNVGAVVDVNKLPMSLALRDTLPLDQALRCALSGGEDYELLFTVPEARRGSLEVLLSPYGVPVTCIGRITGLPGRLELKQGDQPFAYEHSGYQHFA